MAAAVNEPYNEYDCQLATTNGGGNYGIETHKRSRSRYNTFRRLSFAAPFQTISCYWFLSIPPENMKKLEVFGCFQVQKETTDL